MEKERQIKQKWETQEQKRTDNISQFLTEILLICEEISEKHSGNMEIKYDIEMLSQIIRDKKLQLQNSSHFHIPHLAEENTEENDMLESFILKSNNISGAVDHRPNSPLKVPQLELRNIMQAENNNRIDMRGHMAPVGVLSQNTLSLTNYSKIDLNASKVEKDPPMPLTIDSPKAASDSASVNKAVLYSENSIYQLFSSVDHSKRDESILRGHLTNNTGEGRYVGRHSQFSKQNQTPKIEKQPSMSLSQKEKILCQMHNKNLEQSNHYQHVRIEEVMKTFTNSIDQSKKSLAMFGDNNDIMNLSPINNLQNNKNFVNEIQKIAKEIRRIPTEDFRSEEFLQSNRINKGANFEESDSLLEELNNLSSRNIINFQNPYQIPQQAIGTQDESRALQSYMDAPFTKVAESPDRNEIINNNNGRQSSLKMRSQRKNQTPTNPSENAIHITNEEAVATGSIFQDLRDHHINIRKQSKSKLEERKIPLLQQKNQGNDDQRSPFSSYQRQQIENALNSKKLSQDQQNLSQIAAGLQQPKINIKKNQIKFYNLNNILAQYRKDSGDANELSKQIRAQSQNQHFNNNYIDIDNSNSNLVINSLIIVQNPDDRSKGKINSPIDRPFSEMRKLKSNKNSFLNNGIDIYHQGKGAGKRKTQASDPTNNPLQYQAFLNQSQIQNLKSKKFQYNTSQMENDESIGQQNESGAGHLKRNSLAQSSLQRRLQNISAIDQHSNYLNQQQQLIRGSPNISFNNSIRRPQSSFNNSRVINELQSISPYQGVQTTNKTQNNNNQRFNNFKIKKSANNVIATGPLAQINMSNESSQRQSPSQYEKMNINQMGNGDRNGVRILKKNNLSKAQANQVLPIGQNVQTVDQIYHMDNNYSLQQQNTTAIKSKKNIKSVQRNY